MRKGEPIRQLARGMDRVEEEERKIVRFVRTPEGKGVGVIREEGGEAWVVRGRGTRLGRAGRWDKGDHVVVLDGGQNRFPQQSGGFIPRKLLIYIFLDCTR